MSRQRFFIPAARVCVAFLALFAAGALASAQSADFSGVWKQDNNRCEPKRRGDVTLRIDRHGPDLTIETSILRDGQTARHALQKYTTDGRVSVSTGADGDEFHTSILPTNAGLVFSIEEHEDGRILLSKETWTLIDNGAAMQRVREPAGARSKNADKDGDEVGEKQTLVYLRQP